MSRPSPKDRHVPLSLSFPSRNHGRKSKPLPNTIVITCPAPRRDRLLPPISARCMHDKPIILLASTRYASFVGPPYATQTKSPENLAPCAAPLCFGTCFLFIRLIIIIIIKISLIAQHGCQESSALSQRPPSGNPPGGTVCPRFAPGLPPCSEGTGKKNLGITPAASAC